MDKTRTLLRWREKRGQQDKETASAEMLNPNLYPGGLRRKEKPKTLKFPWVSKKAS